MAESTVPITVLVPRSLKRWLAERVGKEGKVGPYVRRILEQHRSAVTESSAPIEPKES